MNSLVCGVVKKDESYDSMCCALSTMLGEERRANGLESEEQQHAAARSYEENAASDTVHQERCANSDKQVPDLKNTINKELDGGVRDSNGIEDLVEII